MPARRAFTLIELLIVLVVAGTVMALALPPAAAWMDRVESHSAARDILSTLAAARGEALARRQRAWVVLDTARAQVRLVVGRVTRRRSLADTHRVRLSATRDSIAYDASGLGYGAANVTIVVARGVARDTVVVSRLGRVRH